MIRALILVALLPFTVQAADPKVLTDESLTVDGKVRHYRLVVPAGLDPAKPAPLVFAFHGMGIDSKDVMPRYTKLDDLAVAEGWILAYPAAVNRSWGITPDKVKADLAFYDALVASLRKKYSTDPDRHYLIGMSNGAYLAHLIAAERSKSVAAVVGHSGALWLQTLAGINAERKFPVMIVHGDKDPIISVNVARENRDKYLKEGHPVEYVEVPGLTHFWATDVKVNAKIAAFFAANPLKKAKDKG